MPHPILDPDGENVDGMVMDSPSSLPPIPENLMAEFWRMEVLHFIVLAPRNIDGERDFVSTGHTCLFRAAPHFQ